MRRGQTVYVVNCSHCSYRVEVVNPRIGREPTRVQCTDWEGLFPAGEVVYLDCPNCRKPIKAQFIYD